MQVAVALRPRSGFVRAMQANALAVNGSFEEAIHCMDVATELEPKNALVWLFRARFYGYTPWPERGVEACKKALELDPNIGGARKLMAELEAMTKKG
jgi:predicted Zn-dependent protease